MRTHTIVEHVFFKMNINFVRYRVMISKVTKFDTFSDVVPH